MSTNEIATWLKDGIEASQAGEVILARTLLQRVVDADEHNLAGWWALSEVTATLEDREVCLENVVALDPNHSEARKKLKEVQARLAQVSEPEVIAALSPVARSIALSHPIGVDFSSDNLDDPWLCVYCGHLTNQLDKQCPNCHRNLYESDYERERPRWISLGWVVSIIDVLYQITISVALLYSISVALSTVHLSNHVEVSQLFQLYLGQPSGLSPQTQAAVFSALPRDFFFFRVGYTLFAFIVGFGLLTRQRVFHLLFIACLAAATTLAMMSYQFSTALIAVSDAATATPFERILRVVIFESANIFTTAIGWLTVAILLMRLLLIFLMGDDFDKVTERIGNHLDSAAKNAHTAFIQAKEHMRHDRWTLAARHLQYAITLDITTPDYFIALAESYAQLKRYPQALAMLDEAEKLHSNQPAIAHLRKVIAELQPKLVKANLPNSAS